MIVLSHSDVEALLSMKDAIAVIAGVMPQVSAGKAELPLRSVIPVGGANRMGIMPGALAEAGCYGIKLVSLFPGNPARGLSSHRGAMVLFEAETGEATAMMDASLLTAVRTAAASGVATRALARPNCETLAIVGYGEQAEHHLDAMAEVRPIRRVTVAGRSADKAAAFCERAASRHAGLTFSSTTDIEAAVRDADLVCTVTASPVPVLKGDWLAPGCHVNVVGSSIPSMREVDDRFVERASIWVDYLPSTLAQAGEIVDMIAAGRFSADAIRAEIGNVLAGKAPGRASSDEITAYRSLGIAAQDLAAAQFVVNRAIAQGRGQSVSL